MRVAKAGVVGAGTMGAAIAEVLALNGIETVLTDVDQPRLDAGMAKVRGFVKDLVRFHEGRADKEIARISELGIELTDAQKEAARQKLAPKVTKAQGEAIVARVHPTLEDAAFADVDLAIEAVFEVTAVKRPVLERLDRGLPEHAVIGSNTSSLSITRLARGLTHRPQLLAVHFFNPPTTLPLVEVAGGADTRDDVVADVVGFLGGLRNHRGAMVPIRVKEAPAFVVNRILFPMLNEACFELQEGLASSKDIDTAMKAGAGMPMGPFELADLIGLDVALEISETLMRETGDPKYRAPTMLRQLVDAGHLGRKSGRGFYAYS
jgi:3-hydroxybutyryl-CoA dehydrogenase